MFGGDKSIQSSKEESNYSFFRSKEWKEAIEFVLSIDRESGQLLSDFIEEDQNVFLK